MDEKHVEKAADHADVAGEARPPSAPERSGESLREKILYAIGGFVLTGILGTIVTTYFQERSWGYQNRVAATDKDTQKALDAQNDVMGLIDARWLAALHMVQALEHKVDAASLKTAKAGLSNIGDQWELHHTTLSTEVEFYVDAPFDVEGGDKLDPVWKLDCTTYPLDPTHGGADPASARVLLEISDHCHDLLNRDLESTVVDKTPGSAAAVQKSPKDVVDRSYLRLNHIWHINGALRCVIVERALAIRRSVAGTSLLASVLGTTPTSYALPDANHCLRSYREDAKLGVASLKQQ